MRVLRKSVSWGLIGLIQVYRYGISPLLHTLAPGCGCRFRPTCSEYSMEAIRTHGVIRGVTLGVRRILRCHPWGGEGWDPVPVSGAILRAELGEKGRSMETGKQMKTDHG